MAKKWKNKLKKQQKAQLMHQAISGGISEATPVTKSVPEAGVAPIVSPPLRKKETYKQKVMAQTEAKPSLLPETALVKGDVKRIGFIMSTILIVLVAGAIADSKTGWILDTANFLFSKINW